MVPSLKKKKPIKVRCLGGDIIKLMKCCLSLIIISMLFSLYNVVAEGDVETLDNNVDVPADLYSWQLVPVPSETDTELEVYWSSDIDIDVWLVDEENYHNYKNGQELSYEYHGVGRSGVIKTSLYSPSGESYRIVFDNTDSGDAEPSWFTQDTAHVEYHGEIEYESSEFWEDDLFLIMVGVGVSVGVIVVIALIFYFRKR